MTSHPFHPSTYSSKRTMISFSESSSISAVLPAHDFSSGGSTSEGPPRSLFASFRRFHFRRPSFKISASISTSPYVIYMSPPFKYFVVKRYCFSFDTEISAQRFWHRERALIFNTESVSFLYLLLIFLRNLFILIEIRTKLKQGSPPFFRLYIIYKGRFSVSWLNFFVVYM